MQGFAISVGGAGATIRGLTGNQIQCAVDRAAFLGGGVVALTAGTFKMADSLHLRTGVTVRGQGAATILRKNPMKQARLISYLGYGHNDLEVDKPDGFEVGDGVIVGDDKSFGFYQTVSTLTGRDGDTWFTSRAHVHDYGARDNGFVKTLFPLVSAVDVNDAVVENLVLDGNPSRNETMNGCRGSGFYAYRSNRIKVRDVLVRDYRGEGFGFQTCDDVELANCTALRCTGNGFHPGSGSNRFHIHDCTARECGVCGLFYCLRVRDSLLEQCVFENNGLHGVSIGERDVRHVNRNLVIRGNGGAGVFLRDCTRRLAAHGNVIEGCRLDGNCRKDGEAEIVLQGETDDIRVTGNRIHRRAGKPGILVKANMRVFEQQGNDIRPLGQDALVDLRKRKAS